MRLRRAIGSAAALAVATLVAACAGSLAERPQTADLQAVAVPSTVPSRATRDVNDDGFINANEARGYFARRFGELDQDGDGRLSRQEIAVEIDQLEDPAGAFSALDTDADLMISLDEYFRSRSERFFQRINPNSGMMTTRDFDTMIRFKGPLVTDQIPDEVEVEGPAAPGLDPT